MDTPLAASRIDDCRYNELMPLPIVIAHHLIWTVYGRWLPNDPRGSMSQCIRNDILSDLGLLHYGRKRIQPAGSEIGGFYQCAEPLLQFPVLDLTAADVAAVAESFEGEIALQRYTCYACAIMPDHVHILIRKHKHQAEEMTQNLQRSSHLRLREAGLRDIAHPIWGGCGWKVFLDSPKDIERTIRYIEDNPIKLRLPRQTWSFVKEYDGWPLHVGHDPNSPYARRLGRRLN